MADKYVRETGAVMSVDGWVRLGVDYDTVSVLVAGQEVRLTADQAERFAQEFISACWQAAQQKARMDGECGVLPAPPAGGTWTTGGKYPAAWVSCTTSHLAEDGESGG